MGLDGMRSSSMAGAEDLSQATMGSVLLISPEPWQGHWVSKHHYARALADAGAAVYFLEPPIRSGGRYNVRVSGDIPGVYVVSCPRVFPALQYLPSFLRLWIERHWLKGLEGFLGLRFDAVWLFENSRFFDMRFAGNRLKIYHQVDFNQNFHPVVAASTADFNFCTSDVIASSLSPSGKLVHKIHHGVAVLEVAENDLLGGPGIDEGVINAVYVGNLDIAYLDIELLKAAVLAHQNVVFHLVGGYKADGQTYSMLKGFSNVRWWGRLRPAGVAAILKKMDLSLLVYKAEEYRDQLSSPHKVMEYLAAGSVCVATYTEEYKAHPELIQMASKRDDYLPLLAEVVASLDVQNSDEAVLNRQKFAALHTYPRQLQKIASIISASGFELPFLRACDD